MSANIGPHPIRIRSDIVSGILRSDVTDIGSGLVGSSIANAGSDDAGPSLTGSDFADVGSSIGLGLMRLDPASATSDPDPLDPMTPDISDVGSNLVQV